MRNIPCITCIHHKGYKQIGKEKTPVCVAFPDGIPDPIRYGYNQHTEPYDGDNGIVFEVSPDFAHIYRKRRKSARAK